MPDHQGRQDFPEVADEKINIGNFKEWSPLGQADIYSPKEEPKLRDQVMLDQEQMLKELCTLIESFNGKKADKKVEDPYKGSSIKKAAGWTMDKQNPEVQGEGFGNDAYYKPPSKKELSTGQRKRLEMARAIAIEPKLLLMDEVTGGVDQKTIPGLVQLIKKLKTSGVTIITIEHNINIIMEISDNILALDQGEKIAYGSPKQIQNNKKVVDSYLGTYDAT